MKVRTFHVKSMHEAIRSIKDTLGPDAVILSTKRVRSWGNGFGLLGASLLEVVAASDDEAAPAEAIRSEESSGSEQQEPREAPSSANASDSFERQLRGALDRGPDSLRAAARTSGDATRAGRELPAAFIVGRPARPVPETFQRVYEDLLAHGVEQATAEDCLRELQETLVEPGQSGRISSLQLLRTVLLSRVKTAGPILSTGGEPTVGLFIGPSGVGKTSTIAKLATHYGLVEQRGVALITMDTYRPAAVEQLRLYAEVLGISLAVATSPDEARAAIEDHREAELILIDTPGFLPYAPVSDQRWRGLLGSVPRLETHLVLAAGTRVPDLVATASKCLDVPDLRLLFTKLDETTGYGGIFETTHRTGMPLSYWGTGQRVPDDLALAQVDRLGDLLLGGQLRRQGIEGRTGWETPAGQGVGTAGRRR